MNILKLVILAWGVMFAISASAGNKETETTKPQVQTRDAASGLPTGKRQHKPLSVGIDNDCNGLTDKACKIKKAKLKKKGYDYYSNKSSMKAKATKQNGDDLVLRKRPGRAAEAGDKENKDKKKPLKHEK